MSTNRSTWPKASLACVSMGEDRGTLFQPRRGYRFTSEVLLLPRFASKGADCRRVLDLGCGSGVLLILMLEQVAPLALGVGLDVQPQMAELARINVRHRRLQSRATAMVGDVRSSPIQRGGFDLVVANPPFYTKGWGRPSKNLCNSRATHELDGNLDDFARSAAWALVDGGRFYLMYAAERLADALQTLYRNELVPTRLMVVPHPVNNTPHRVFVEAIRQGTSNEVPGLVVV